MQREYLTWQIAPFSQILINTYGDEVVVFDTGSGSTLALDPIAAATLCSINEEPQTNSSLTAKITETFLLFADTSLETYIDSLLHSLQQQNLIQPIPE